MSDDSKCHISETVYYRNCERPTVTPILGAITGVIPPWLQGELTRVGPGIKEVGNDVYNHVFDGLAILHKFSFQNGEVYYQSRALESDAYKRNMTAKRIVVSEFGTIGYRDPCETIFGRLKANFLALSPFYRKSQAYNDMTDNCTVNLSHVGDELYAMTETSFVRRIDPVTLETVGDKTDISDYVAVNTATAHPHVLPDGTVVNMGNVFNRLTGPHYGFFMIPPGSSFEGAKMIAEIPSRWKLCTAYFHSFGVTNSGKIIFIETPYCLDIVKVVTGVMLKLTETTFSDCLKWCSNEKTRFYVVDMASGKVNDYYYETDNLFVFHHINAYEENGNIIVDVAGYNDANWVSSLNSDDKRCQRDYGVNPSARRYVLPLNDSDIELPRPGSKKIIDVKPQHLSSFVLDLPQINLKYNGRNYKYFYAVGQKKQDNSHEQANDMIYKVNVQSNTYISWKPYDNCVISEPVFAPNPTITDADEDDGVVLSVLLPVENPKQVSLIILSAKDLTELGRVEFTAAGIVTSTLHGIWVGST